MEISEFATHLTRFIYLVVAVVTLFEFVAHRDETRLDITLMFWSFGVTVLAQEYVAVTGLQTRTLTLLQQIPLMAQPYLLVRLVGHFRPVPLWVRRAALAGMLASWVLLLVQPSLPAMLRLPATLVLVVYFAWAEGYATLAFIKGARSTGGVTHWRLLLAAIASGLVAGVILSSGILALLPGLQPYSAVITQLMSVTSGLAFYAAFAPPRWLRHTWQLDELHRFLEAAAGKLTQERAEWILGNLCETAMRAVGGRGALALARDELAGCFVVRAATHAVWVNTELNIQSGAMAAAWQQQAPRLARTLADMSPEGRRVAEAVGASSLMAVPIGTGERRWGLLVVKLRRSPLFADDDMNLLLLFAEQAALALEQAALVTEQRLLVEDLKARTAQLEATNAELEAFSYSVSHDLRAPLRHIEGFTDLLRRDGVTPEQQRIHLQRVSEAAVRMGRLIDDLLTFSRMGRAELRRVPVPLDELVAEVRRDLAAEEQGREVAWRVAALPEVQGDPDLLRLALYNLLSNAVKYTRGRPVAEIEVGVEAHTPQEVILFVRDNGVGFDMQYVDKLFGVFQRLHHADEFEGVGIGLANVRRIVNRHGGRTWAISQLGKGAAFFVALPVRGAPAASWVPVPTASVPAVTEPAA